MAGKSNFLKRSHRRSSITTEEDVQKILEERERFFNECLEVDRLKADFDRLEKNISIIPDDPNGRIERQALDVHPGQEIFLKDKRYQYFNLGTLASRQLEHKYSFQLIHKLLKGKILPLPELKDCVLKTLFYLMAVDPDYNVCQSCLSTLESNMKIWIPKLKHIVKVLMNWGATIDTLRIQKIEKHWIFGEDKLELNANKVSDDNDFRYFNFVKVFSYLISILKNTDEYSIQELYILIKLLCTVSLHTQRLFDLHYIVELISVTINAFTEWEPNKVLIISKYLYDEQEHVHNLIAVSTTIIPSSANCADVSSCLSFAILHKLIKDELKFIFPIDGNDLLQLINSINLNVVRKGNLYMIYLMVYLINFITIQKNIPQDNPDILKEIQNTLETVRKEIFHENLDLDAELLKGRIMYCASMWSLFGAKELNYE